MIFSRTKNKQELPHHPKWRPKWLFVLQMVLFVGLFTLLFSVGLYVARDTEKDSLYSDVRDLLTSDIVNLEIVGYDNKNRFYILTAASAKADDESNLRQFFADEGILNNVEVDIEWQKDNWLSLRSRKGRFNNKDKRLSVGPNFNIYFNNGYQLSAHKGSIELKTGGAIVQGQVQGWGPLGEVRAAALDVEKGGEYMRFYGGVEVVMLPKEESGETK